MVIFLIPTLFLQEAEVLILRVEFLSARHQLAQLLLELQIIQETLLTPLLQLLIVHKLIGQETKLQLVDQ